ncbi:hypothetical protein A2619_03690 [candidate division WWE3 bacterium RIFOXYD1_FULL_39_9]|nr:MAG: hypothetical protein A2619_03690 [candidate division WWE3 bacterium RIFOXYD1_FULL_39_9]
MPNFPILDDGSVPGFLKDLFKTRIVGLKKLKSSEQSIAFKFKVNRRNYILRIASTDQGFFKDQFVRNNYFSKELPVPKTYYIGKMGQNYYSVTSACPGKLLDDFSDNYLIKSVSKVLDVCHAIYSADVSKTTGFGDWDQLGNGRYVSWSDFLLSVKDRYREGSYWPEGYFMSVYGAMERRVKYCPNIRKLIHGDLGSNNILVNRGKVSGVIDWSDSKYGDFVYDVAYLGFWVDVMPYRKVFPHYFKSKDVVIVNYKERFDCYTLNLALSILIYYSDSKDLNGFTYVKSRLDKFVKAI